MLMYIMLEGRAEIAAAQKLLETTLKSQSDGKQKKTIGYPGGNMPGASVQTFDAWWFWSGRSSKEDSSASRNLNWFGRWTDERHSVDITVEINTAHAPDSARIGGFFARDATTGTVYLFHSGKVGGGKPGVGKQAFLAWSKLELNEVVTANGKSRSGIMVGPIDDRNASATMLRYVKSVAGFKEAVDKGVIDTPTFQKTLHEYGEYYKEWWGQVKARRARRLDYVSRHGEVVDALKQWREQQGLPKGRSMRKNQQVDLGVGTPSTLDEVYEVKTSTDRNCVYGGIGQLMVHGRDGCRRVLVLPDDGALFKGLPAALSALGIELIRYRLGRGKVELPVVAGK
jgi:hypothetical protein